MYMYVYIFVCMYIYIYIVAFGTSVDEAEEPVLPCKLLDIKTDNISSEAFTGHGGHSPDIDSSNEDPVDLGLMMSVTIGTISLGIGGSHDSVDSPSVGGSHDLDDVINGFSIV